MPSFETDFSPRVRLILAEADQKIRRQYIARTRLSMYDYWRTTVARLCPVDAFYVGYYQPNQKIAYVFQYDDGELAPPDVHTYGEHSIGQLVKTTGRPYRFSDDGGRLLNRGVTFGAVDKLSADAVCIPLFARGGAEVIGIASIQTYDSGAYSREHVEAFALLGRAVVTAIARDDEDARTARSIVGAPDPQLAAPVTAAEALDTISFMLAGIVGRLQEIGAESSAEVSARVDSLVEEIWTTQTFAMDVLRHPRPDADNLLEGLSDRERQIAFLVAGGRSDREIAQELGISVRTVETHIGQARRKLRVSRRSGIIDLLRPGF